MTAAAPWRVVLVVNALQRGGAETQLVRLAGRLVRDGHQVSLLTITPNIDFVEEIAALGVRSHQVRLRPRARAASSVLSGAAHLHREQPDLIVSFLYQANILARVAGRLGTRAPIVCSIRNEFFGSRAREVAMRVTDRCAAVTTTNSELAAASLVRRRIVPAGRLVVIPNGLPLGVFERPAGERATVRSGLGVDAADLLWVAAGRLSPQKAWPTLFGALAATPAARGRVVIAGEGPLAGELRAQIQRRGLGARVTLLGPRRDLPALLGAADVLVQSSDYEGLPNVVLEAMASGRPVVATAVGGTPELVADGVTGLLVPPGDPVALGEAMARLAAMSAGQRAVMGAAGRVAAQRFDEDRVMDQWLDVLGRCVRPAGRGRLGGLR